MDVDFRVCMVPLGELGYCNFLMLSSLIRLAQKALYLLTWELGLDVLAGLHGRYIT